MEPGRIGEYEIEGELGTGGMATVYRARHPILETRHAIKVLAPSYRSDEAARKRFTAEARLQASHLDHPNIVKVTNIIATAEHAAIVMELIEGESLEQLIGTLQTEPDKIKRIMLGVLDAVGYAHERGVIHRDLKPANVLLAKHGDVLVPKVTDFGIAKVVGTTEDARGKSTHADARMGTLQYMSPEQVRGAKNVTARSDVFSLGAMLYEMATGALPFDATDDFGVMRNIVDGTHVAPAVRYPRIDPQIATTIERAMNRDPEARFASCKEMADSLRGSSEAAAPPATKASVDRRAEPEAARPPPPSRRGLIAVLATSVLLSGGAAVFFATRDRGSTPAPVVAATLTGDSGIDGVALVGERPDASAMAVAAAAPADASVDAPVAAARFVTSADGTVTDGKTGLRWAVSKDKHDFDAAKRYCANLSGGAWRLASVDEMRSLHAMHISANNDHLGRIKLRLVAYDTWARDVQNPPGIDLPFDCTTTTQTGRDCTFDESALVLKFGYAWGKAVWRLKRALEGGALCVRSGR